jgi:hypothetical protein
LTPPKLDGMKAVTGFESATEMKAKKADTLSCLTEQYSRMLAEHFDDYAGDYDRYLKPKD